VPSRIDVELYDCGKHVTLGNSTVINSLTGEYSCLIDVIVRFFKTVDLL